MKRMANELFKVEARHGIAKYVSPALKKLIGSTRLETV
jgi:hypothetical protein